MKPFNLEEAKAGKPVCTRSGDEVTIYDFDFQPQDGYAQEYKIVCKRTCAGGDHVFKCQSNGKILEDGRENQGDLMMAQIKKEGWINIYTKDNHYQMGGIEIYNSREGAFSTRNHNEFSGYLDTIKIEWSE